MNNKKLLNNQGFVAFVIIAIVVGIFSGLGLILYKQNTNKLLHQQGFVDQSVITPSPIPAVITEMYTNQYLPGFSVKYNSSAWTLEIKEFGEDDHMGFTSGYKPGCDNRCLGLRLSQEDVSLEIVFQVAFDDFGFLRCSNETPAYSVDSLWTRVDGDTNTYYTTHGRLDYVTTEDDCNTLNAIQGRVSTGGWVCQPGVQYTVCDSYTGVTLKEFSTIDTILDESGVPILMEKPKIYGEPTENQLEQLDEIVTSITF